jgi:hypothetical protein
MEPVSMIVAAVDGVPSGSIQALQNSPCLSATCRHNEGVWGGSSVGRALQSHCRGRGFDSLPLHFVPFGRSSSQSDPVSA